MVDVTDWQKLVIFLTTGVNRFLERERYKPKDLFLENQAYINLIGGTLRDCL